jgi:hypothetical protein
MFKSVGSTGTFCAAKLICSDRPGSGPVRTSGGSRNVACQRRTPQRPEDRVAPMSGIVLAGQTDLRLDASPLDYVLVAFYFVLVLGIGFMARRSVSSSLDFLLSGRSMPA